MRNLAIVSTSRYYYRCRMIRSHRKGYASVAQKFHFAAARGFCCKLADSEESETLGIGKRFVCFWSCFNPYSVSPSANYFLFQESVEASRGHQKSLVARPLYQMPVLISSEVMLGPFWVQLHPLKGHAKDFI